MSENILDKFMQKKKDDSVFISLADGESIVVKRLRDLKLVTKAGFGGEEKEVIRLKCEVETSQGLRDKDFDNGTARFAKEMQDKGVVIGCGFTLTRTGQQTKTRYTISDVVAVNKPVTTAPASTPAA